MSNPADLRHGPRRQLRELPDRDAARAWIIDNQLARRNLGPAQAAYLRGKKYIAEKKDEGRPEKLAQSEQVSTGDTATKVAKSTGVSRATVVRDAEFATAVDPRVFEMIEKEKKAAIRRSPESCSERDARKWWETWWFRPYENRVGTPFVVVGNMVVGKTTVPTA